MATYTHSILASNQAITADGDVTYDLPVQPLSVLLIHISPLNNTATITDYGLLERILSAIDQIRVVWKGDPIFSLNGFDAAVLAMLWHRVPIWQSNAVETNNDRRSIVLPVIFGRRAFMPSECFPRSLKGEFRVSITWDIADTGFDGLRISLETIELPDATPDFVQKATALASTFTATGQNDIDLPIGNVLRGVLLFGTTPFSGGAPSPSLGEISFLVNNRATHVSQSDWEVLRSVMGLTHVPFPPDFRHIHSVNAAGAGREDTEQPEIGVSLDDNYALINLDPTWDDLYSVPTVGVGRVHLRIDAETADAVRVIPIERVDASQFRAG